VWNWFFNGTEFSDRFQICWDLLDSLLSPCWFPSLLRLAGVFVPDWPISYWCWLFWGCLGLHTTVAPSIFGSWSCFLDSNGPITFDSRSEVRV
jgi:hypothetical protein